MKNSDAITVRLAEAFGQSPAQVREWGLSDVALVLNVWKARADENSKQDELDESISFLE